jgi:hypothetical protein
MEELPWQCRIHGLQEALYMVRYKYIDTRSAWGRNRIQCASLRLFDTMLRGRRMLNELEWPFGENGRYSAIWLPPSIQSNGAFRNGGNGGA